MCVCVCLGWGVIHEGEGWGGGRQGGRQGQSWIMFSALNYVCQLKKMCYSITESWSRPTSRCSSASWSLGTKYRPNFWDCLYSHLLELKQNPVLQSVHGRQNSVWRGKWSYFMSAQVKGAEVACSDTWATCEVLMLNLEWKRGMHRHSAVSSALVYEKCLPHFKNLGLACQETLDVAMGKWY